MAPKQFNRMQLPPGLGVPSAVQDKFQRLERKYSPYAQVGSNQYGPSIQSMNKGSLIQFHYLSWIHDPQPLVIITDIFPNYIRGVNLHYLTFPYILKLLQPHCGKGGFSYYNIRADQYIVNAFRTYKRSGIKRPKMLDCSFILDVLGSARAVDPNEVDTIRQLVQEQIKNRTQETTDGLAQKYQQMIQGQAQAGFQNRNAPPQADRNIIPPQPQQQQPPQQNFEPPQV